MSSDIHSKDNRLYTLQDLSDWTPPPVTRIIAGGLLNLHGRMIIFGGEGSWKSMLAQHLAHCLARGSDWLGFRTSRCNVFKLQVELPQYEDRERMLQYNEGSKRIYLAKHPVTNPTPAELDRIESEAIDYAWPPNIISRTEQFIHIGTSFGFEDLKKNIITCKTELYDHPLVVILDPIYKMFGGDLSSAEDMDNFISKMDIVMSDAKDGLDFTTIIVAHSRKTQLDERGRPQAMGSQDIAGSRHLMNWADTILRIDEGEEDETSTRYHLTFTKHRTARVSIPLFTIRWDSQTLHPTILHKRLPVDHKAEDTGIVRTDYDLSTLE